MKNVKKHVPIGTAKSYYHVDIGYPNIILPVKKKIRYNFYFIRNKCLLSHLFLSIFGNCDLNNVPLG